MTPAEIAEAVEEGDRDGQDGQDEGGEGFGGEVLMRVLDLVLEGWAVEMSAEKVGVRLLAVGAAMSHKGGAGLPMLGARKRLEAVGSREMIRRILEWCFLGAGDALSLGKKMVTVGKFLGHAAFDDWSMSNLGRACGETPQAMQERMEVMCEAPLRASGSKGKAAWQQPEWQREQSREAQLKFYQQKNNQRNEKR